MIGQKIGYYDFCVGFSKNVVETTVIGYKTHIENTKRGYEYFNNSNKELFTKIYFDIDIGNEKLPLKTKKDMKEYNTIAKFIIRNDLKEYCLKNFGSAKFLVSCANGYVKKDDYEGYKVSYHIIIKDKCVNASDFITFMKTQTDILKKMRCDTSIYRMGWSKFRTPNTLKYYDEKKYDSRIMKMINGELENHFVQNVEGLEKVELKNNLKEETTYEESKSDSDDEEITPDAIEEFQKVKSESKIKEDQECIKKFIHEFENTANESYSVWFTFGSMLYGIFNGSDEGLKLFTEFSALSTYYIKNKYQAEREIQYKWNNEFKGMEYHPDIGYLVNCAKKYESNKLYKNIVYGIEELLFPDIQFITDKFLADEFYKKYCNKVLYHIEKKKWYVQDKYGIYKEEEYYLVNMIQELGIELVGIFQELKNKNFKDKEKYKHWGELEKQTIKNIQTSRGLDGLIKMMKRSKLAKKSEDIQFDENRNYWGFKNGVFSFKDNKIVKPPPGVYISKTCGYDYEEKVNEKIRKDVLQFLEGVHDEKFLRDQYLLLLSRALYGNKDEKLSFWLGKGRNGKGVLKDLAMLTFGNYCKPLRGNYFQQNKHGVKQGQADSELAACIGARLVVADESSGSINWTVIKEFTGRNKVPVRALQENSRDEIINFSLVFNINTKDLPRIDFGEKGKKNEDKALEDRIVCFEFKNTFVDDPNPENPREKLKNDDLKDELKYMKMEFWRILKDLYITKNKPNFTKLKEIRDKFLSENSKLNNFIESNLYSEDCSEDDYLFKLPTKDQWKIINKNKKNKEEHLLSAKELVEIVEDKIKETYKVNEIAKELINFGYYKINDNKIIETKSKGVKMTPFLKEESEYF